MHGWMVGPLVHVSVVALATVAGLVAYGVTGVDGWGMFLAVAANLGLVVAGLPLTLVTMALGLDESGNDLLITLVWGACGVAMAAAHLLLVRRWAARRR